MLRIIAVLFLIFTLTAPVMAERIPTLHFRGKATDDQVTSAGGYEASPQFRALSKREKREYYRMKNGYQQKASDKNTVAKKDDEDKKDDGGVKHVEDFSSPYDYMYYRSQSDAYYENYNDRYHTQGLRN